ncbi:MAG: hypothetical protein RBS13_06620 [Bacteroidales bacterium]|jgi:hypothetical protein|nr:hypothetical protein [Bacteroidales bacterium]
MKTLFKTIVLLLLSLLFIHCKPEPIDYRDKWCGDYICNDSTIRTTVAKVNDSLLSLSVTKIIESNCPFLNLITPIDVSGHFYEQNTCNYDAIGGDFYKDSLSFWTLIRLIRVSTTYYYAGVKQ